MPGSDLIGDYLAVLSAQLPAPVVEELAHGLDETCQHYLGQGLDLDAAAETAITEFGEPGLIVAAFTRLSPARCAARRLLATGPVVGVSWGAALITSRTWDWPVPVVARFLFGIMLITVIGLLASAASGRRYKSVRRAGASGCAGVAALDVSLLIVVMLVVPAVIWPLTLAAAASVARLTFSARTLWTVLAV